MIKVTNNNNLLSYKKINKVIHVSEWELLFFGVIIEIRTESDIKQITWASNQ